MENIKKLEFIREVGRTVEIECYYSGVADLVSIERFQEIIDDMKENKATHVKVETQECYDGTQSDIDFVGCIVVKETDEEFKYRLDQVKRNEEYAIAQEKAQYLRLKAKYEVE